jgi:glycosyltransferase involved in cell wall biosynthesis
MKVSIAVPSFNYASYLDDCLRSLAIQDHHAIEVLIADGGSTDGSLAIIERYVAADPRFRLMSTSDAGQADAINKMLALATGDIFCFLNADDRYLCTDAVRSAVEAFERYPGTDVVSFGGYYLDAAGTPIRPVKFRYHPLDDFHLMKYRTAVLQQGTFWRRRVQERFQFQVEFNCVFDSWFFYQVFREFAWLELDKPVAGYRLHNRNKSGISAPRVRELAAFESFKFGARSFRAAYLRVVARLLALAARLPGGGRRTSRALYLVINSMAYASAYRLPGI